MGLFFSITGKAFDVLLWPFRRLPPFWGFFFIAMLSGFLAVVIFKYVSDQKALKEIMTRIKIHFAEIFLYREDIRHILFAQKEILKNDFRYFIRTIKPAVPIGAVVLTILSQINIRYSIRPLSPGEPLTVKMTMATNPGSHEMEDVQLILPFGIKGVTPAFHHPEARQIEWRITGNWPGEYVLNLRIGSDTFQKKVIIGQPERPFSPHLGKEGFVEKVFNPLEKLLPRNGPIEVIDLGYQSRSFSLYIFGWSVHWLAAFLGIAIIFGLFCRKLFKVS